MTVTEGKRPGRREVRIEDCRGVKIFDNPAPRCPHGKNWRESDYDSVEPSVKQLMCPRPECEAIEYHPHAGKYIVLSTPRSFSERNPVIQLYAAAVTGGSILLANMGQRIADGGTVQDSLQKTLSECVVGWNWEDAEENQLPLPSQDWNKVVKTLEQSELWWILRAILSGGDPDAKAVESKNGSGG